MASPGGSTRSWVQESLQETYGGMYPGAFSAADIRAVLRFPGGEARDLGNLAGLSVSTHRDAFPVTSMTHVGARGFTRGHRTVAGTLLFHTLDRGAFAWNPYPRYGSSVTAGAGESALPDQLPLFDIYLTYVNEVGMFSLERIFGVCVLDMGKTVSLESLHPVEQYSYMALDYSPLRSLTQARPAPLQIVPTPDQQRAPRVGRESGFFDRLLNNLEQETFDAERWSRDLDLLLRGGVG